MDEVEPQRIGARIATLGLAVHGLLDCLQRRGILDESALHEIRDFGLTIAADLEAHTSSGAQVGGARVRNELRSFFRALGVDD